MALLRRNENSGFSSYSTVSLRFCLSICLPLPSLIFSHPGCRCNVAVSAVKVLAGGFSLSEPWLCAVSVCCSTAVLYTLTQLCSAACRPLREHRPQEQVGKTWTVLRQIMFSGFYAFRQRDAVCICRHMQIGNMQTPTVSVTSNCTVCVFIVNQFQDLRFQLINFFLFPLFLYPHLLLCPLPNLQSLPQECCWGWRTVSLHPVPRLGSRHADSRFQIESSILERPGCAKGYFTSHLEPGLDPAAVVVLEHTWLPWRSSGLGLNPQSWALRTQPSAWYSLCCLVMSISHFTSPPFICSMVVMPQLMCSSLFW